MPQSMPHMGHLESRMPARCCDRANLNTNPLERAAGRSEHNNTMSTSTTYVIRRADGQFWADLGRWSPEYPDAYHFGNWKNAAQEAMSSTPISKGPSQIIADYGLESQRVVLNVEATILGEPL